MVYGKTNLGWRLAAARVVRLCGEFREGDTPGYQPISPTPSITFTLT